MLLPRIFALIIMLVGISACSSFTISGTVYYAPVSGECWTIIGDDKVTYEITNLPKEFQKNGLQVRAKIKLLPDMSSICMVGPIAEIETIDVK